MPRKGGVHLNKWVGLDKQKGFLVHLLSRVDSPGGKLVKLCIALHMAYFVFSLYLYIPGRLLVLVISQTNSTSDLPARTSSHQGATL